MESKKGKMCIVNFSSMLKAKGQRITIYLPIMACGRRRRLWNAVLFFMVDTSIAVLLDYGFSFPFFYLLIVSAFILYV